MRRPIGDQRVGSAPRCESFGTTSSRSALSSLTRRSSGARFAPPPLSDAERAALSSGELPGAPPAVLGDYPEWLEPHLARVFGDDRAAEGAALATRAPLDLRVNELKAERDDVVPKLAHLGAEPTRWSPIGLRIHLGADAKNPAIHAEPPFRKGEIEVQDEGSQLAALLTGARPGQQVVDLAAGAGGKTLALAAMMDNSGQIYATDIDKRQLAPIHERLTRAGVRNVQVRTPRGAPPDSPSASNAGLGWGLTDLAGRADLVIIDAPCTGTGTWRRNPDAKWRVRPGALDERLKEQAVLLDRAAPLVKRGGRIAYITCSVLAEENGDQVRDFIGRSSEFVVENPAELAKPLGERAYLFTHAALISAEGLQMTPRRTDTDGFFVSLLRRSA